MLFVGPEERSQSPLGVCGSDRDRDRDRESDDFARSFDIGENDMEDCSSCFLNES